MLFLSSIMFGPGRLVTAIKASCDGVTIEKVQEGRPSNEYETPGRLQ